MDTRFWGPSGWKLFHLMCADGTAPLPAYHDFLETLPYVLPCLFCRASLTDYFKKLPYKDVAIRGLPQWIYRIHNMVNDKLRKQGLHPAPNPPYAQVRAYYTDMLKTSWQDQLRLFWDFLFAVAYHHPNHAVHTKPMPDCPTELADDCEKNKWNLLPLHKRMDWFKRFWHALPDVFPIELRDHWRAALKHEPPQLISRRTTMAWIWRMRCRLDRHDPYTTICDRIASYSSDCGTRRGSITCRRSRSSRNKTAKNKAH